jgi:hypothetical protein
MSRLIPTICLAACLFLGNATTLAQDAEPPQEIEFAGNTWSVQKFGDAGIRPFLGRESLFLERAQATLVGRGFSEGVIEFQLAAEQPSGFVGVNFRADDKGTNEQFYVRFHQSERPDATQYLARFNRLASWQLHAGPNDAAAVALGTGQWIPIRIVVEGNKADIFVRDMDTPLLHIPELRSDNDDGEVSFYAFERPGMITGAYFSELSVRPLADGERVSGTPREEPPVPDTVFRSWKISDPLDEAGFRDRFNLDEVDLDSLEWGEVDVERNGVLNIARYKIKAEGADTVLVRLKVNAEEPATRLMQFGYSDRVRIYVNGEQQFYGNAQWRSRDHRFLGTVGLHDAVVLHLDAGDNEVVAAVSESFGGWGFIGQIENRENLSFD